MNYIDVSLAKIEYAKEIHYKYWRYIIKRKLNGRWFTDTKPFSNITFVKHVDGIHSVVKAFLNNEDNLRKVLIGNPAELDSLKYLFKSKKQKDSIRKICDYESWDNYSFYNRYDLAKNLDIPTCPYCNRMYTKTVLGTNHEQITRPTFDHWFSQSDFPLFAVSFFNLIPSCNVCNSGIKGNKEFNISEHFHPYLNNPQIEKLDFRFSYDYKDLINFSFKVIANNPLTEKSIEAFKIEEVYKAHEDEIKDLKKLKDIYSDKYLEILYNQILNRKVDREEIYRLAFGTYVDEANFDRRPLSKMKKDILTELGII
ncbi:hypothetical protein MTP09_09385 [Chryseobacterium suipulveris]|uniref:HNH endonuclease n=1 Tax=Chryseobacterium suipulveris TaxID=2929800 RepID=A0ABY4BLR7_9FLAO|nr:hypothetical protein [Chryseobacterium suipulveris]UOE40132.1 hypothetical protein MTP09_09385 [Chryseobacterium suipulveris]